MVLAHLHLHLGDLETAREFADYGLRNAGMAVGPKKMLRQILKMTE